MFAHAQWILTSLHHARAQEDVSLLSSALVLFQNSLYYLIAKLFSTTENGKFK